MTEKLVRDNNISLYDFNAIKTLKAEVYIFTIRTLYKINSRALLLSLLRTGNFTIKCPCPEPFREYSEKDTVTYIALTVISAARVCILLRERKPCQV